MHSTYSYLLLSTFFFIACTQLEKNTEDTGVQNESVQYPEQPELSTYFEEGMEDIRVPGLQAALIKNGSVVWSKGFGFANTEEETLVTTDTPFMLASISKTVTAVAIMKLYEQGLFQLDDDINDYLDLSVHHPSGNVITFRHLLKHSSSIRDEGTVFSSLYQDGDSTTSLREFVISYFDPSGELYDLENNFHSWKPGEGYEYSNFAVALLGYLVERIANQDFSLWCSENIFSPLGMTQTGWHLADFDESMVAYPHNQNEFGNGYSVIPHYGYPDYPDGQLRSSAQHMARFLAMFANGGIYDGVRVLQESTVELMRNTTPIDQGQGMIWYQFSLGDETYMGHGGLDRGVRTRMGYRISDGSGFIISLNAQPLNDSTFWEMNQELMLSVDNDF